MRRLRQANGPDFPFTPGDGFVLSLNDLCRRGWGGNLTAVTELVIEGVPDRGKLGWLCSEIPRRLPMLNAEFRRGAPFGIPCWRTDGVSDPIPLTFHGTLESAECERLRNWRLQAPSSGPGVRPHLRIDAAVLSENRWILWIIWDHLLVDAAGIERLVPLLNRLWKDPGAILPGHVPYRESQSVGQRLRDSRSAGRFLFELSGYRFPSASNGRATGGRPMHLLDTFTAEESGRCRESLRRAGGDLMAVYFYVVVAARAHRAVLRMRGVSNSTIVIAAPVQLRPRGQDGNPVVFQNHMSMLFYVIRDQDLDDVAEACRLVMRQSLDHLRGKRHRSFYSILSLMRRLPGHAGLKFARLQQGGEIVSLFHSWTGEFAGGEDCGFGGTLLNAYHVPAVSSPPGTGLFFSECNGRLSVVLGWVESCLTDAEVAAMHGEWRSVLLGGTHDAAMAS